MKITKLELKNFKRFDDLTIDMTSLAKPAKLVLLIGTNGSGKSSIFDAFEFANKYKKENTPPTGARPNEIKELASYYEKKSAGPVIVTFTTGDGHRFHNHSKSRIDVENLPANGFYGRTSIRQVPQLTRTYIGNNPADIEKDSDRPRTFIERDNRFENDIEDITTLILKDVFNDRNLSTDVIRQRYIVPINKAFKNIFGIEESLTIRLISFIPPTQGKTAEILFEKGTSKIPYDYLSGGEKEIFNIMLNLLVRTKYFTDTVYFLDEVDLHLNTALQKNLLKEIVENWIPDNCQLWTASHSLGFIEYANEAEHATIIDFDNLNFDIPQLIQPSSKKNFDVFEIAVSKEFLANLFEGRRIVFSENTDTPLYNNLKVKDTVFFNAKDKADVFFKAKNNQSYYGLIDRDYLTDDERIDLSALYKNLFILGYYSIENYLYHPDNLAEYYELVGREFNRAEYINAIKMQMVAGRDKILMGLAIARDSYPFYRENENVARLKTIRDNNPEILAMYDSDDLETFYKIFPAKDYGKGIKERQNINPAELAKTKWFKSKIEQILVK